MSRTGKTSCKVRYSFDRRLLDLHFAEYSH